MTQKYKPPPTTVGSTPKEKVETLLLSSIKNKFDVRVALDQDRVLQFAGMYEGRQELPPIEVVKIDDEDYAFIDGRHRAEARKYLNLTDIQAVVRSGSLRDDPAALFGRALKANWGGSQPPTREDIQHTILRMLEAGVSRIEIEGILSFIPKGSLRAYTAHSLNQISKRKIAKALDAIADGSNIEQAAKKVGLKADRLKEIVAGKKGTWGKGRSEESHFTTGIKAYISQVSQSTNNGIAKKVQFTLQKVDDGEISLKGATEVITFWKKHVANTTRRIADWEARLDSIAASQAKSAGGETEPAPKKEEVKTATPVAAQAAAIRSELNGNGHAKKKHVKRSASDAMDYVGERLGRGFWNEELPKAIRATGAHSARPLLDYFEKKGKTFTFKQVDGALQRLKKRGMEV